MQRIENAEGPPAVPVALDHLDQPTADDGFSSPRPTTEPVDPAPRAPGLCGGGKPPVSRQKLAEILVEIAEDEKRERVSVADLVTVMQDRAFGALMLIFAMPNALPTPPGTSAILGAPLVFLAAQLTFGRQPWLPRFIADRSMLRTDFAAMIGKAAPWIARAEKLLKPRLVGLSRPPAEYGVGRGVPADGDDPLPADPARQHAAGLRDLPFLPRSSRA